jgi:hypothetical protein
MFANVNLALGLTVPVACMIGAGVFVITVFSVNATIIAGGFILTALAALAILAILFFRLRRGASRPATCGWHHNPLGRPRFAYHTQRIAVREAHRLFLEIGAPIPAE